MIAELGVLALVLAGVFALLIAATALLSPFFQYRQSRSLLHAPDPQFQILSIQRQLALGHCLWLSLATCCLLLAFIQDNFSLAYVVDHSSRDLPWFYKLFAWWGGHEGSMLLWVLLLSMWTLAVAFCSPKHHASFISQVLAVLALIAIGFEGFILLTSNPFIHLPQGRVAEGHDLNPLLQDLGFLFHPPILYMGYVGFAVAFAFALVSLISGKVDVQWARWARPWTLLSWCFLTLGISLGSWWSYRELGWGGWWFWDPVENASFMPWLAATALLHSLAVTHKQGLFKAWTVLLALTTFSLSLLGTFLVRSGVLTSVHAFAVSPQRGLYMLAFLAVVVGISLLLFACRVNTVTQTHRCTPWSREVMLLGNNVLLAVMLATVLLGTLYPLVIEGLGLGKLSVGAPYFNQWFSVLGLPLLILLGLGPHCQWQRGQPRDLWQALRQPIMMMAVLTAILIYWSTRDPQHMLALMGIALGVWVVLSTITSTYRRVRRRVVNPTIWGMTVAHLGVGISVLGIAVSQGFGIEKDLRLRAGQAVDVGSYTFRFDATHQVDGANFQAVEGEFSVIKGKSVLARLHPQQRLYHVTKLAMTDADVRPGIWQDWYIALGQPLPGGGWSVRIYVKPMVRWIWGGGVLMMFGGLIAISRRHKIKQRLPTEEALCYVQ